MTLYQFLAAFRHKASFSVYFALLLWPASQVLGDIGIHVQSYSVPLAHRGVTITSEAFSPDGRIVAVGMTDGTVALYQIATKHWILQTHRLHPDGIQAVALSPDGTQIATCSSDNDVVVSNAQTGALIKRLPVGSSVVSIAFSPDGKLLAAGSIDQEGALDSSGKVLIWSIHDFQLQNTLGIPGPAFSLSFSQSGKRLAVACGDTLVFALPSGKTIWRQPTEGGRTAAISPDGTRVICTNGFWNIETQKKQVDFFNQDNFSAFSRSGRIVIGGSAEDGVSAWDGRTGHLLSELDIYEDFAMPSPTGTLLATGYGENEICLWKIDETQLRKIAYHRDNPTPKQAAGITLVQAINQRDLAHVKSALAHGADPNRKLENGESPLSLAAFTGKVPIFQALLNAGASWTPQNPEFANRILSNTVGQGSIALMQFLLDKGMVLPKKERFPLLYIAAEHGNVPMLTFLLDHGASINATEEFESRTALMAAAEAGKADAVKVLLQRGADPTLLSVITSDESKTPQHKNAFGYALDSSDLATITLLVDTVLNLNDSILFPIPVVLQEVGPKSDAILTLLLDKGADPNARSSDGRTALMDAAYRDLPNSVAILLTHGADVNLTDKANDTAFNYTTNDTIRQMLSDGKAKSSHP